MDASVALCPRHPQRAAEGTCSRCGTFVCEECRQRRSRRTFCVDCSVREAHEGPSPRARLALKFSTAGFLGFVPGLAGLVLGMKELAAIRRGEAPVAGEPMAVVARNVGWFHLVMLLLVVFVLLTKV
ncbi:hypothetical protein LZ198_18930 [Myxococcus sp. K15C18031901]|uniref:B-box zinc finger protein n=1 Tax=Myxococcus dinghuensis TaxID=2906761 RepID=UPI0020A83563|nr:B-box zinc finger protein [Myxococcus dinghuensis]MCP3100951.1 hypothetical protein [Myxococcus dinghuensis]